MIVNVDIEKLIKYRLDINQYLFCSFIYQQSKPELLVYIEMFGTLIDESSMEFIRSIGYLDLKKESERYRFANMFVTDLFVEDFIEKSIPSKLISEKLEDWFDEWFDLWPRGIKSGGYLVKSDKQGCITKMGKFIKKYPEYTKDVIIRATKDYVNFMRMKQYNFMQLAHYFIDKNGISNLGSSCEDVKCRLEREDIIDLKIEDDYSRDIFTKSLN